MSYSDTVTKKLNDLLEKNYNSEKMYNEAAEKAEDQGLRNFFEATAKQRYDFGHELKAEIKSMGGKPDKGTSTGMDVLGFLSKLKSTVLGNSDKSLLNDTIKTDKSALEEYNEVLKETSVYPSTHNLLEEQRDAIQKSITNVDLAVESMTAPKK